MQGFTQTAIERHASADSKGLVLAGLQSDLGAFDDGINDGLLISGADARGFGFGLRRMLAEVGQQCGLQAAERDTEFGTEPRCQRMICGHLTLRKGNRATFGQGHFTRHTVNHRAAWVTQAQELCGLIKGFACGIIDGLADELVLIGARSLNETGVATTHGETQLRILRWDVHRAFVQLNRPQMRVHMVDGQERFAAGEGQALGRTPPH